jgi:uncharacterized protein GlcG (DUF336 family)
VAATRRSETAIEKGRKAILLRRTTCPAQKMAESGDAMDKHILAMNPFLGKVRETERV